jgi:hypothetical protein
VASSPSVGLGFDVFAPEPAEMAEATPVLPQWLQASPPALGETAGSFAKVIAAAAPQHSGVTAGLPAFPGASSVSPGLSVPVAAKNPFLRAAGMHPIPWQARGNRLTATASVPAKNWLGQIKDKLTDMFFEPEESPTAASASMVGLSGLKFTAPPLPWMSGARGRAANGGGAAGGGDQQVLGLSQINRIQRG